MLEYVFNVYLQNVLNRYVWPDIILTTTTTTNISISCLASTKFKSEKKIISKCTLYVLPKRLIYLFIYGISQQCNVNTSTNVLIWFVKFSCYEKCISYEYNFLNVFVCLL